MHRPTRPRTAAALASGAAAALLLTACGSGASTGGSGASSTSGDGRLSVVASTDVWGDVAASVGGDRVDVTSVIDDTSQDPHSFEATTRDQLLVQDADVLVENGGGYDDFMEQLVEASGSTAPLVDAVDVSGLDEGDEHDHHSTDDASDSEDASDDGHDHGAFNEHVWYDLPTAGKVATAVAEALSKADPEGAATYTANAQAFVDGLVPLQQEVSDVATRAAGVGVGITEPVPDHLLESMGLTVVTPEAFSEAVEEGTDVSPSVLADTEAQFRDGTAKALVYNEQTEGPETEAVLAAAKEAGVAVVPVTETLPQGQDYTQWMTANVAAVRAAVGL